MIFLQDTVVVSSIKVTLRLELNRDNILFLVTLEALVVIVSQSPLMAPALFENA